MPTQAISTGTFCEAKWVVDPVAGQGTHTTIASALTSASSGDTIFIRPGTYTENLTLKSGVNLTTFDGEANLNTNSSGFQVTIVGSLTATFAGTCNISNICLQTNSLNILIITGTSATVITLNNCYINATNTTAIAASSSNTSTHITLNSCHGNLGTTGITYFTMTHGVIDIFNSFLYDFGSSTTISTLTNEATVQIYMSFLGFGISTANTAAVICYESTIAPASNNVIGLTLNGTSGLDTVTNSSLNCGTASCITIGTGATCTVSNTTILSSNTNTITGIGTLKYALIAFTGSSSAINTTTQTALKSATITSTMQPSFLAYLASNVTNATGNGTAFTLGTTTALTKVFDQGTNLNTNGTFTAPITGIYGFQAGVLVSNCTIASAMTIRIVTTGRTFYQEFNRAPGSINLDMGISILTSMTAGDTAIASATVFGEAGATNTVNGSSTLTTYFSGNLVC